MFGCCCLAACVRATAAAVAALTRANTRAIGHLARGAAGRGEVIAADGLPMAEAQEAEDTAACLIEGFTVPEVGIGSALLAGAMPAVQCGTGAPWESPAFFLRA